MSWSISVPASTFIEFPAALDAAVASWRETYPEQATPDVLEQISVAAIAAKLIAASGCVARPEQSMAASLSGHVRAIGPSGDRNLLGVYFNQVTPKPA